MRTAACSRIKRDGFNEYLVKVVQCVCFFKARRLMWHWQFYWSFHLCNVFFFLFLHPWWKGRAWERDTGHEWVLFLKNFCFIRISLWRSFHIAHFWLVSHSHNTVRLNKQLLYFEPMWLNQWPLHWLKSWRKSTDALLKALRLIDIRSFLGHRFALPSSIECGEVVLLKTELCSD